MVPKKIQKKKRKYGATCLLLANHGDDYDVNVVVNLDCGHLEIGSRPCPRGNIHILEATFALFHRVGLLEK